MKKVPSHSKTSFKDTESIGLIKHILASHNKVMPMLYDNDKWPNIDGHLEILDEKKQIVGRIYVQAKTLPKDHRCKAKIPIEFFLNCEISPCLLLCVDNVKEKIYWEFFDSEKVKRIGINGIKQSKTINLNKNTCIDKNNKVYVSHWLEIANDLKERVNKYEILKADLNKLLKDKNSEIGKLDNKFINIHIFLDTLNYSIDKEFPIIKEAYFKNAWKVGIAYFNYEDSELSYTLFPIFMNQNDVIIKKIDSQEIQNKLRGMNLILRSYSTENPIINKPIKYAKEIINWYLLEAIKEKKFNYNNEFISLEFVFAFIDRFHKKMGLSKKDSYSIKEIEMGLHNNLLIWVEEIFKILISKRENYRKFIGDSKGVVPLVDLMVLNFISPEEEKKISFIVNERLLKNKYPRDYYLKFDKLPIQIFIDSLEYLKRNKLKVKRLYKEKDFERLQKYNNNLTWNSYSQEDLLFNINIFFNSLHEVFNRIIENNFSFLKDNISLFGHADKLVIYVDIVLDNNGLFKKWPIYFIFGLKAKKQSKKVKIDIYVNEDHDLSFNDLGKDVEYLGDKYKVIHAESSSEDFLYQETPMMNYVQKILIESINNYFKGS